MKSVRMTQMRRNLLSVLTRRDDELVRRRNRHAFDRNTEAFERLMETLDRFDTRFSPVNQRARCTNDFVAELNAWCAASRVRRRELLERVDRLQPPAEAA
jgi:uncharacterized protein with PIN domain